MSTLDADTRGYAMSEAEMGAVLERQQYGVLSLARDGVAYAVPMSHGLGDGRLYFVFRRAGEQSRKLGFVESTTRAAFVVTRVATEHDWASVVVEGPVRPVAERDWDALYDAIEGNAWFPSLFSETDPREDFLGYELRIERQSGRKGTEFDPGR